MDYLPDFLDPLLEYCADILPRPVYLILVKLLSHSVAAFFAIFKLCNTLLAKAPEDWNAQTILPPIITLLAAYLAISSFYRTTSWLLRISFFFMKWGAMFGVLLAFLGYLLGSAGGDNALANQGGIPGLVGLFGSLLEDPRKTKGGRSANSRNKKRPKAWESFDQHKEWRHRQGKDNKENQPAQDVIAQIMDTAGNLLGGAWYGALKNVITETSRSSADKSATHSKASRNKSKGKAKVR